MLLGYVWKLIWKQVQVLYFLPVGDFNNAYHNFKIFFSFSTISHLEVDLPVQDGIFLHVILLHITVPCLNFSNESAKWRPCVLFVRGVLKRLVYSRALRACVLGVLACSMNLACFRVWRASQNGVLHKMYALNC